MHESVQYPRILLKISGEALSGDQGFGLDTDTLDYVATEIVAVRDLGVQLAVVVGGGNFIRGDVFSAAGDLDRTVADHMGMLGTIMNALALQAAIERHGIQTRVQSAISIDEVCEPFIRRRAIRHLEHDRVVVFAGGTGNPYFSTDTAAVLRALEIGAGCLIKATKVDGVYDKDPKKYDKAVKYERLTYEDAISKRLAVMDQTAFTMCRENRLPVIVLDLSSTGGIQKAVTGEPVGTYVGVD
ncbi:MAG: UMP kinase [Armatimonadetes bacterium]|nr:UMP kinase [Armatimonadota bacterium]